MADLEEDDRSKEEVRLTLPGPSAAARGARLQALSGLCTEQVSNDGTYKGAGNYQKFHVKREVMDRKAQSIGPIKAPTNVRMTCRHGALPPRGRCSSGEDNGAACPRQIRLST